MAQVTSYRQQRRQSQLLVTHDGFSLVELMVVVIIVVIATVGVSASFRTFTRHSSTSLRENEQKMAIEATFRLLKRDLNMAGFGLPAELRLAEDDSYETAIESDLAPDYDCNSDGDSDDSITEACVNYDLDGDGDNDTTTNLTRDRLYIADGWNILIDITDNNAIDGDIVESPTDYYYTVAEKKEDGGYFAKLTSDVSAGATSISVDDLDINRGAECNGNSTDFKSDASVILYGQDSSGIYSLEGLPVGSIADTTIHFLGSESIDNNYEASGPSPDFIPKTKVVPAITWYVEKKTNDKTHWLYRNRDKVLPGVIGFRTSFGYDRKADGLEWYSVVPPRTSDSVDGNPAVNSERTAILKDLRAVRLVLTLKRERNDKSAISSIRTYEKIILLKN